MNIQLESDYDTYKNPLEGKSYISPEMKNGFGEAKPIRIITRGIDHQETYKMYNEKSEILLRQTPAGKNIISAKVFVGEKDGNNVPYILNIQEYTANTGNPHKLGFAFVGEEITKLYNFIRDIQTMRFGSERYQKISDNDIEHLYLSDEQAVKLMEGNRELFKKVVSSKLTSDDIVAIGYRKKQLEYFEKLLSDEKYFNHVKDQTHYTNEKVWQMFFEKNQWIFGYGLGYLFLSSLDDKKLEQVVQGFNVNSYGKRVDALMKSKGIISNLCFVEIKTDKTELLEKTSYRLGCYAPSSELSGAVAQIQGTVASAIKTLSEKLSICEKDGTPTNEEIYNYQPKAFLVIGNMNQFVTENGVNQDKLRSFELYRKNIQNVEIITFDELYERARFIVDYNSNDK